MTFCTPAKEALQSLLAMNLANSSDQRPCSPLGLSGICVGVALPVMPASLVSASLNALVGSEELALEREMMKFFWQPSVIGLVYCFGVEVFTSAPAPRWLPACATRPMPVTETRSPASVLTFPCPAYEFSPAK